MNSKRTLIINADDLGYTRGINDAIFRCHREGVLRSATLMANGRAFEEAVKSCREHTEMGVGIHLVLTELDPVAPPGQVQDLLDHEGRLPGSPGLLLRSLILGRVSASSLRNELHAQLSKVLDSGIRPTHLDTHKHVHLIPQVLQIVAELAKEFGIDRLRKPFDGAPALPLLGSVRREHRGVFLRQHLKAWTTRLLRRPFHDAVRGARLTTPDSFFGISLTGIWNESATRWVVKHLPPGVTEWMMHPGNCDSELRRNRTRLLGQREVERDILLSPFLKQALLDEGIQLKHFGEELPC